MDKSPSKQRTKSRQSLAHISSKSNTTTDIAALRRDEENKSKSKRTRGKSLGPGGLKALTETSGNAFKIPPALQPKSILKPTIPLTPPKAIPSFHELRNKSASKANSPVKSSSDELLIDFSTPGSKPASDSVNVSSICQDVVDPFSPQGVVQDAAALKEQETMRQEQKKAILEQRAARRKSMGARRVSFAPEATLHTWSVMEMMEDSTTSSAANSTRRQSSMTADPAVKTSQLQSVMNAASEANNDALLDNSHISQRELHQRKRRRISDQSQSDEDDTFSSPGDGVESSPIRVEDGIESDSDTDGDTAMSLEEATQNTIRSSGSSSTQTSLDERLRSAASQAGVHNRVFDSDGSDIDKSDNEEQPMEIADSTITHAFRGYGKRPQSDSQNNVAESDVDDAEASYPDLSTLEPDQTEMGMTMDMTRAIGGIVSNQQHPNIGRKDRTRTSMGHESSFGDETMDMTVAKGGILSTQDDDIEDDQVSEEEMTMEMTRAVGGISSFPRSASASMLTEETESMDMTIAQGGILAPIEEQTEPQSVFGDDMTGAMEMTKAVGGILNRQPESSPKLAAMNQQQEDQTTQQPDNTRMFAPSASETGSPTLRPRSSRRSISATPAIVTQAARTTSAIRSPSRSPSRKSISPVRTAQDTPTKQVTPAPLKSVSAKRTPILPASVATRGASPKKLFTKELQQRASPGPRKSPGRRQDVLFSQDTTTGLQTPKVVLHAPKPHQHLRRRSSGVGLDVPGTGSPKVSQMLAGRLSIGETAAEFQVSQEDQRQLRFADPKVMEQELDREREEEHRRESGRFVMSQETSQDVDDNNTANLRSMIQSMTPKKDTKQPKFKARKSLAIGSARGLLGKRPMELDIGDEEDECTPKRLKTISREGSPVKKVHLPKPPSKEETTGRLNREQITALNQDPAATPTLSSPIHKSVTTPGRTGHFKSPQSSKKPVSFEQRLDNVFDAADMSVVHPETNGDQADEKIGLQAFLNLTNIHFIELSTTKRRHTTMVVSGTANDLVDDQSSRAVFGAAATTLPLLDLYQHATRELKSYISSGRKIIRQIEEETLADQPALFRQYLDASPDLKLVMENQFRSAKSNARLQSKEGWYTWRGQLVDGLQTGLDGIKLEMQNDDEVLGQQRTSLQSMVPDLELRNSTLQRTLADLQHRAEQLNDIDHDLLKQKRHDLNAIDSQLRSTTNEAEVLQHEMLDQNEVLETVTEMKQEISAQVDEALRVQDEQRTWHANDVQTSKRSLEALETQYGWKVLNASATDTNEVMLRMKYKSELIVELYPSYFTSPSTSRAGGSSAKSPAPDVKVTFDGEEEYGTLSTARQFALARLQTYVQEISGMAPGTLSSQTFLASLSQGWTIGQKLESEVKSLEKLGIVRTIHDAEIMRANLMLMLPQRGRIDITFSTVPSVDTNGNWSATTDVTVKVVYGQQDELANPTRMSKIQSALVKEVEAGSLGSSSWFDAVHGFKNWLRSRDTATKPEPQLSALPQIISPKSVRSTSGNSASPQRARTQSPSSVPVQSTTPRKPPPRSPLAPKTTNSRIAKRATSTTKKVQHESLLPQPTNFRESQVQKENLPLLSTKVADADLGQPAVHESMSYDEAFGLKNGIKPAIPPELQEAMMHTPMKKRAGALRRSPL